MAKEDPAPKKAPAGAGLHSPAGREEAAPTPPSRAEDLPAVGSKWQDSQGRTWTVEQVTHEGQVSSILMGSVGGANEPRSAVWYNPEAFRAHFTTQAS